MASNPKLMRVLKGRPFTGTQSQGTDISGTDWPSTKNPEEISAGTG